MIEQPQGLAAVGKTSFPSSDYIQDVRVEGQECGLVGCDDKESSLGNSDIGEKIIDALQSPSSQVNGAESAVMDLNPLFERILSAGT